MNSQELQQRIQKVVSTWGDKGSHPSEKLYKEEMTKIRKDIVDFHGEMVLLMNYSNINYTGRYSNPTWPLSSRSNHTN